MIKYPGYMDLLIYFHFFRFFHRQIDFIQPSIVNLLLMSVLVQSDPHKPEKTKCESSDPLPQDML